MGMKALMFNCLPLIWIACLNAIYWFDKLYEIMMHKNHCLLARIFESVMHHVICGFLIMTHVTIFHCVVLTGLRNIVTFSHLMKSVTFSDVNFAWLVLLNIVYVSALLECLFGKSELVYMTYLH